MCLDRRKIQLAREDETLESTSLGKCSPFDLYFYCLQLKQYAYQYALWICQTSLLLRCLVTAAEGRGQSATGRGAAMNPMIRGKK